MYEVYQTNLYAYIGNKPSSYYDRLGLVAKKCRKKTVGQRKCTIIKLGMSSALNPDKPFSEYVDSTDSFFSQLDVMEVLASAGGTLTGVVKGGLSAGEIAMNTAAEWIMGEIKDGVMPFDREVSASNIINAREELYKKLFGVIYDIEMKVETCTCKKHLFSKNTYEWEDSGVQLRRYVFHNGIPKEWDSKNRDKMRDADFEENVGVESKTAAQLLAVVSCQESTK